MGLHYFFRTKNADHAGDLVFFQGHSSPGIYARAYLEGRLSEAQLDGFRQEFSRKGLSSYPHPWLMPDFWQFPTVSMGLGPLMAIYQARFLRYLDHRGLKPLADRKVWAFCGDGEMGEPESLGALNLAGREQLDNLIFVINCNLQRLDGPVFGNGSIVQEYESVYSGAGWRVIKVLWGSGWDELLAQDTSGLLLKRMGELVDGEYQHLSGQDGAYFRSYFFGKYPELAALVAGYSDEELKAKLQDGGHDVTKVLTAYRAAVAHTGQPVVLLIKTVKGYGMGHSGEAQNITHQTKKVAVDDLKQFCQRFQLAFADTDIESLAYAKPEQAVLDHLAARRQALGGHFPVRHVQKQPLTIPPLEAFSALLAAGGDREFSTTMAFVRALGVLLKDPNVKERVVPIAADECRTFGMEGLFRQIGIYSPFGQCYEPEDRKQLAYYREDTKGQLLQEGISEAGAMCSWVAAAVSYMANDVPMIPFYIYYSMFGYQRFGDLVWASGDIRARGFILGATAGRTTLNGEGLQHEDGHNYLMFSVVPNCVTYDPTFAYEVAVIMQDGLRRMYQNEEDVFYYITLMNENYHHPAMPKGAETGIVKGLYLFRESTHTNRPRVQLLGAGTILCQVIEAADRLEAEFGVAVDVWSVTSFNELHRDIRACARWNRLHPESPKRVSHVSASFVGRQGPVVAATDYIQLVAEQIRADVPSPYYVLGTDGFGRSDTRAALRDFFEVDAKMVAYTALVGLYEMGTWSKQQLVDARKKLGIDADRLDPVTQ